MSVVPFLRRPSALYKPEAVRIRVKKCEGNKPPEYKKFCVDPEITSFETIQNLLIKAFEIKTDFRLSYVQRDTGAGTESYVSLWSDWDLDAAFLEAAKPHLRIRIEIKPPEEGLEEWDVISPTDLSRSLSWNSAGLLGALSNSVDRAINSLNRAIGNGRSMRPEEDLRPKKNPMRDSEFRNYLDCDGRLIRPAEFRYAVYQGGLEPSLRRTVWKILLDVYPAGMTGNERISYMRQLCAEYVTIRDAWLSSPAIREREEMAALEHAVRKDVMRTDKTMSYFNKDKNSNALANLLVTYAYYHPRIGYCQGMSDLAAPLLYTMGEEAHAYVCFCALMRRVSSRFAPDGFLLQTYFATLRALLRRCDSDLWTKLETVGADGLLFTFRWLLLECKREFPFEEALQVLEVIWASEEANPPENELLLVEPQLDGERRALYAVVRAPGRKHRRSREPSPDPEEKERTPEEPVVPELNEDSGVHEDPMQQPTVEEIGQGVPLLIFICLALIILQRDTVLQQRHWDADDIAIFFDRKVRSHSAQRVLALARSLFAECENRPVPETDEADSLEWSL